MCGCCKRRGPQRSGVRGARDIGAGPRASIQLGNVATCEWAAGEDREDPGICSVCLRGCRTVSGPARLTPRTFRALGYGAVSATELDGGEGYKVTGDVSLVPSAGWPRRHGEWRLRQVRATGGETGAETASRLGALGNGRRGWAGRVRWSERQGWMGFLGSGRGCKGGAPRCGRGTAVLPLTPQQTEEQDLSKRHGPAAGVSPPAVRPPEAPTPNWYGKAQARGRRSIRGSQATDRGIWFPCWGTTAPLSFLALMSSSWADLWARWSPRSRCY